MTDINDLYEPGDDREPEPCEWHPAPEPLDLNDLQKLYDLAAEPGGLPAWGRIVYLRVPDLIAELREARERIAGFEALPTREEWAVSDSRECRPNPDDYLSEGGTADKAFKYARAEGGQAWRRRLTVHEPEPIDEHAPF